MKIREFFEGEGAVKFGLWMGRHVSLERGRSIADWVGKIWSKRKDSQKVAAIKANQWVVSGETLDKAGLNVQTQAVCQSIVKSLFEYFYFYQHPEEGKLLMRPSARVQELIEDVLVKRKPTMILGPHLGNFDLFGLMFTWLGIKPFALSMPNPSSAYKAENELRRKVGVETIPLTFSSFREAKQQLKSGRCVITGLDRPVGQDEVKYPIHFFGREANLPGFYPKLVLDSGAIVRVAYGVTQADGSFLLDCSDPFEMQHYEDNISEVILNVEKAVSVAEQFIRQEADHWAMFYPVWPETLKEIENLN
ncbi:MAG: hypothetical protein WBI14_02375 [Anaerolineaceae bacterium]